MYIVKLKGLGPIADMNKQTNVMININGMTAIKTNFNLYGQLQAQAIFLSCRNSYSHKQYLDLPFP
jgi:hypothetical protein